MSRTIALPDEILQKAAELAAQEHVSIEEFVSAALSEQLAGVEYLKQRAARATRERFRAAMDQVPDVPPDDSDRIY